MTYLHQVNAHVSNKYCLSPLPQGLSISFAHRSLGDLVDELHNLGNLVSGQPFPAIGHHFFFIHRLPLLELQKDLHRLPANRIRHPHGAGMQDFGVGIHDLVDFPGVDIEAAGQDHVRFLWGAIRIITVLETLEDIVNKGFRAHFIWYRLHYGIKLKS